MCAPLCSFCLGIIFPNHIHDLAVPTGNICVILSQMGCNTSGTVLHPILGVPETSAALLTESIEGTVAKQAIEVLRVLGRMAGKIFAERILKKGVVLFGTPVGLPVLRIIISHKKRLPHAGCGLAPHP